jgi:chemotaxis protein CheD
MFGSRPGATGLQIGERNAERTRAELLRRRIPVRAGDTGGSAGRSVEVHVASGRVLVRRVGHAATAL